MLTKEDSPVTLEEIQRRFISLLSEHGNYTYLAGRALFDQIKYAYLQPGRHFHDIHHIQEMFEIISDLDIEFDDPDSVTLAIIFHQIIYDPKRFDNNYTGISNAQQNADTVHSFLTEIGCPAVLCNRVRDLIMLTETHNPNPEDKDGQFFLDIDAAVTGMSHFRYQEYVLGLAKEFLGAFSAKDVIEARELALTNMLSRNRIFHTDLFEDNYAAQARENMQWEQKNLRGLVTTAQHIRRVADIYDQPTPPM